MSYTIGPDGLLKNGVNATDILSSVARGQDNIHVTSWYQEEFTLNGAKRIGDYNTANGEPPGFDYDYGTYYPATDTDPTYGSVYVAGNGNPYSGATSDIAFAGGMENTYKYIGGAAAKGFLGGGTSYGQGSGYNLSCTGMDGQLQWGMIMVCRVQGPPHRQNATFLSIRDSNPGQHGPQSFYNTNAQTSNGTATQAQLLACYENPRRMTNQRTVMVSGSGYGSYMGLNFLPLANGTTKNNAVYIINEGYAWMTVYGWGYGYRVIPTKRAEYGGI